MANPTAEAPLNVQRDNHHYHHNHHHPHNNGGSAVSVLYKRAIIHALQELQDYHHRSNIDCIRRKAQSSMIEVGPEWNETLFQRAFKSLVESGQVQKCNPGHIASCELSPEMKKKVTSKAHQIIHTKQLQQIQQLQQQQQQQQQQFQYAHEQYQLAESSTLSPLQQQQQQHQQLLSVQVTSNLLAPQLPSMTGGGGGLGNPVATTTTTTTTTKSHRRHSIDSVGSSGKNVEKETVAKKTEHFKDKIIPKKLYDHMFVPIKNPMLMD